MITKSLAIDMTPKQNVLLSLNCITMKKNKFQMCNTDIVRGKKTEQSHLKKKTFSMQLM